MTEYNTKVCTKCKRELPATKEFFSQHLQCKYGLNSQCKDCRTTAKDGIRKIPEVYPEGFQRCTKCKRMLEATPYYFYRGKGGRNGLCSICKDCRAVDLGAKRHRLVIPIDQKQCCRCSRIYPATTEYFYKDAHIKRDGLSSSCKNCESAKHKTYRRENKDRLNARERELWHAGNKAKKYRHKIAVKNARRRARIIAVGGEHTADDIKRQLAIQNHKCWWCGVWLKKYHVDHLIPLSRGGHNGPTNIVIACPRCNLSKGDKMPHEWSDRLL